MSSVFSAVDTAVLIPAAGPAPEGVLALSQIGCPAMIPVAGRPVIYWTLSYLSALGFKTFIIAVSRRGMFIEDFVDCVFGDELHVRFIVPPAGEGLGGTVHALAQEAQSPASLIVLGDTYFQFDKLEKLDGGHPFVLTHPVEASYRWCMADVDTQGHLSGLHDKESGLEGRLNALIGVYYFPKTTELRQTSEAAVTTARAAKRPLEMSEILRQFMPKHPIHIYRPTDWLDCGNPDSQARSNLVLLQKRAFNELSMDSMMGTITKRSQHKEKFINEINYLRLLPQELQVLYPRVLSWSTQWEDPSLTMEFYGYPTLSEIFLFENVDPGIWQRIFEHLCDVILKGFMKFKHPLPASAMTDMYIHKTRQRVDSLQGDSEFVRMVRTMPDVEVNGRPVRNLAGLWDSLDKEVSRWNQTPQGSIIHGDFCFSNILYDLRSRVVKLVDPRGNFGGAGVYGDPRYDVAKLFHSIYGHYDFIVNDLFRVSLTGSKIMLDIHARPSHAEILKRFEKVFFAHFDRRDILIISGLLFVSMPPLHYDHPKRQLAMYAKGLLLLDEAFQSSPCASV